MNVLEASICRLTAPINGQYPRPWMTDMMQPEKARVFIVGYNQATPCPVTLVDSHEMYIDALYNRNGQSCRKLYDQMRGLEGPSPTRINTDTLRRKLNDVGIHDVVETNVICYSSAMGSNLVHHQKIAGRAIFFELLNLIRPAILIVHGQRANKELSKALRKSVPMASSSIESGPSFSYLSTDVLGTPYSPVIFAIPSLAPPKWNSWCKWAPLHLQQVAEKARDCLID